MTGRLEPGLVSHMTDSDRLIFLSDAKIEFLNVDDTCNELPSIGQQCMSTLDRIVSSLQKDHVLISKRVAMSKRVWESDLYVQDTLGFPVLDVPIKCNAMFKVVELLRSYGSFDGSFYAVFSYLKKILKASNSGRPRTNQSDTIAETKSPLETTSRIDRHFKGLSIDSHWLSNTFSPSRQNRPSLLSSKGIKSTPNIHREDINTHRENYTKFPHYKQLVTTLCKELSRWDPDCLQNEPLFAFVYGTICHFILQDCKVLLVHYVDRRLFAH